ncbi:MAG TPA: sigma-70 family RNA polymerase sigma factor [Acidobacteriaceae bacterium]
MPRRLHNGNQGAPSRAALPSPSAMTGSPPATRDTAARLAEQHSRFLQFLRARVGDFATAEDILQAAYLKALQRSAQLRNAESSVAWFYRVLRNAIVDHYRQQSTRARAMNEWAANWNEAWEPELRTEICSCILEAVSGLKPEYRAAIEQVDLGGESVEAFARAQRTTANNASVRLHRARKAVARQITAICGTNAIRECPDCTCKL